MNNTFNQLQYKLNLYGNLDLYLKNNYISVFDKALKDLYIYKNECQSIVKVLMSDDSTKNEKAIKEIAIAFSKDFALCCKIIKEIEDFINKIN